MLKTVKCILLVITFVTLGLLLPSRLNAQCISCGTVITVNSNVNITLTSGQSLCINAGVTYSGNITINGGTLCNSGTVTNVSFLKGVFNNYGLFNKTGGLTINNTDKMYINCFGGSIINISGSLNQTSNNDTDTLGLKLFQGSQFTIANAINNTKGWLKIRVGSTGSNNTYSNSNTLFNINGQLNVSNAGLDFINYSNGYVNINKAVSLDNTGNKSILNYGTFNINNSFNIGGNGQNTGLVTINNQSYFNITQQFNASYTNGTVNVNNNTTGVFVIGKSLTLSKDNNNFANAGNLSVTQDITIERGSIINTGTITARDVDTKFGVLTNNNVINSNRDFISSNIAATINNNGYINVANEFNNKAVVNLGMGSLLQTTKYYNLGNNAYINGPPSVPDTASYARIMISGYSENSGFINGRIIVYDASLQSNSSNIGFGFDQVNNSNRIANTIAFAVVIGPIGPPVSICSLIQQLYKLNMTVSATTICAGSSVTLSAQFYQKVIANIFFPYPLPSNQYNWLPAASFAIPNQQTQVITPAATTTYTVKVVFSGCIFTKTVTIVVMPNTLVANAGQDRAIIPPAGTTIGGNPASLGGPLPSASGGTPPYAYLWIPNSFLAPNNTVANPIASPVTTTTYTLKVTDGIGCQATDDVIIYIQTNKEYATLLKKLDGSFYTPVNNILYFTIDGEYSTMNLSYTVYNFMRSPQAGLTLNTTTLANGDNRYAMTITPLNPGYYVLEVENQKKEKLFLRFKK